jgi:hypothetical protein
VDTQHIAEHPGRAPTTPAVLETQNSTRHHCNIHRTTRNLVTGTTKRPMKKQSHNNHTSGCLVRRQPARQYTNAIDKCTKSNDSPDIILFKAATMSTKYSVPVIAIASVRRQSRPLGCILVHRHKSPALPLTARATLAARSNIVQQPGCIWVCTRH